MEITMVLLVLGFVAASAVGAVAAFAFYRGWFTADKDQLKNDARSVINKL